MAQTGGSSRQQRAAEGREAVRRRDRRRTATIVGVVAAAVLLVGGGIVWAVVGTATSPPLAAVRTYDLPEPRHVDGEVDYAQSPPVGGDHAPVWLNCGYYDEPVPNENAVHDLEHGAVWITYRPDLPADQVAVLRQLTADQTYVTTSPFPDLPSPVVASAWGVQLQLPSATDPGLEAFVREYVQGPQTPEPGAPCTGGIGTPSG